ncbi:uncharacterized protein LOC122721948 [Manihot esculenta]|uniref:uncharacterized protein LOC122721948 n=1 Tax=Manihot esculenta TaxID=3983 RepID=UPI001CC50B7E|nr:uncharacterized protein LOC122721948 [Manihot esculenta]
MANRLKRVLQDVISKSQSAFIENKLIFDNSLIDFELAHFMKRKTRGQDFWAALKLDICKAFDHIKWAFICRMIEYGLRWILDQQSDDVHLLYLLYYTSGRSLLSFATQGKNAAPPWMPVSHLFFANDSFIFFKANSDECEHLKERLLMYELSSGQKINLNKSKMIFSRNTLRDLRTQLANFVGVSKSDDLGVYLGLPSFVGRNRKEVFSYIKDRIWHRLNSWKRRFLSRAGKEVIMKSVV